MKKQVGFTLIELIIVIIILGILAAYAVPKYMQIDKEARISVVKGIEGSTRAASDMVHSVAVAKETTGAGGVQVSATVVVQVEDNLYPTAAAAGIAAAIADYSGFTLNTTAGITFEKKGAPNPATCSINYTNVGTVNDEPIITRNTAGC